MLPRPIRVFEDRSAEAVYAIRRRNYPAACRRITSDRFPQKDKFLLMFHKQYTIFCAYIQISICDATKRLPKYTIYTTGLKEEEKNIDAVCL